MRKPKESIKFYSKGLKLGLFSLFILALTLAAHQKVEATPTTVTVPTGTNIQVDPIPELSIVFPQVTGGDLTVDEVLNPSLPQGYRYLGSSVYSLNFTGSFTGSPLLCVSYKEIMVFNESRLKLLQHNGTDWTPLTSFLDTIGDEICSYPTSLTMFAVAEETLPGFNSIYFPSIYDGVLGWRNYITIQGLDSSIVNLKAYFYETDGTLAVPDNTLCPTCTNPAVFAMTPNTKYNVTPNWALYEQLDNRLFEGTVIVEADSPVIGLANALGPNKEAFNIYESAKARTHLVFSKVFDGRQATGGKWLYWVNYLQLQNVENSDVSVNITLTDAYGVIVKSLNNQIIPAHGKFEIKPTTVAGFSPVAGSIQVSVTGGKVAGMMKYMYGDGAEVESYSIYEANELRTTAFFPRIFDTLNTGDSNYVTAANVNPTPVTVTLDFYRNYGLEPEGVPYYQYEIILGQNQKLTTTPTYLFCGELNCAGFAGSLVMRADGPIYATTNTVSPSPEDPREAFNIYEATEPAQTILFPKVNDGFGGWENEATILNIDSVPHNISILLYKADGSLGKVFQRTIPAYGQYKFSPMALNAAPFRDALEVVTDVPGVISGVLQYKYNGSPAVQSMTIYEGISK